jgi:polar amino acid transport system substrate-binding protein
MIQCLDKIRVVPENYVYDPLQQHPKITEYPNMVRLRTLKILVPLLSIFFASAASADAFHEILERGTIRIGIAEFAPWTIKTKSGELIGSEIEVSNTLAKDMGVKADFKVYEWDDLIPALQKGEIDIIAAGMAITPARALKVEFTRPTATSGIGIATNIEMTKNIKTLAELNDSKIVIAAVTGTMSYSVADVFFDQANVKAFATPALAEKEVLDGRAHVYLAGMPAARYLALKDSDKIDIPVDRPLLAHSEAIAVRRGEHALMNYLNAWITAKQSDQWMGMTRSYWFEKMSWVSELKK